MLRKLLGSKRSVVGTTVLGFVLAFVAGWNSALAGLPLVTTCERMVSAFSELTPIQLILVYCLPAVAVCAFFAVRVAVNHRDAS